MGGMVPRPYSCRMSTPLLTQPLRIHAITLPARLIVAPMCQYSAVDGCATDWHAVHIGGLACGGFGLVVMEATAVEPRGRITPQCLGIWGGSQEAALAQTVGHIRAVSSTPLGIQIAHAGRKASTYRPFRGEPKGAVPLHAGGWESVGPSSVAFGHLPAPRALEEAELAALRDAFRAAAARAARIGFDYLEVHAAHGYLLASFLSPLSNQRRDRWGGGLEGRMRFPLEVVRAVREEWPRDRVLGVRFGGSDWAEGGWTVEEACEFGRALRAAGVDVLHVSSAGNAPVAPPMSPGWLVPHAAAVRAAAGGPVFAVGELQDPRLAEKVLQDGAADAVAVARGALRDPRLGWHAAEALGGRSTFVPQYEWAVAPPAPAAR